MQELAPTPPRVGLVLQYLQDRPTSFWEFVIIIKNISLGQLSGPRSTGFSFKLKKNNENLVGNNAL